MSSLQPVSSRKEENALSTTLASRLKSTRKEEESRDCRPPSPGKSSTEGTCTLEYLPTCLLLFFFMKSKSLHIIHNQAQPAKSVHTCIQIHTEKSISVYLSRSSYLRTSLLALEYTARRWGREKLTYDALLRCMYTSKHPLQCLWNEIREVAGKEDLEEDFQINLLFRFGSWSKCNWMKKNNRKKLSLVQKKGNKPTKRKKEIKRVSSLPSLPFDPLVKRTF